MSIKKTCLEVQRFRNKGSGIKVQGSEVLGSKVQGSGVHRSGLHSLQMSLFSNGKII
jgi:hypothetical protein